MSDQIKAEIEFIKSNPDDQRGDVVRLTYICEMLLKEIENLQRRLQVVEVASE